jgi:hypothetical protein
MDFGKDRKKLAEALLRSKRLIPDDHIAAKKVLNRL